MQDKTADDIVVLEDKKSNDQAENTSKPAVIKIEEMRDDTADDKDKNADDFACDDI